MKDLERVEIVEKNVIRKRVRRNMLRIAIAYPSSYMVGMSSLSVHLLYYFLNIFDFVYAERVFMEGSGPYRSVETGTPLKNFDVILFSVHYELDYVNIVRMLRESGIEPLAGSRRGKPIIIIGGPTVSSNPEPIADIADAVFVGEIEPVIEKFVEKLYTCSNIIDLADVDGIYVPSLGKYNVRNAKCTNLNDVEYPVRQIVTLEAGEAHMPIFGKAFYLEICRGCPFMCKFCMESHVQFPFRIRSFQNVKDILDKGLEICEDVDKIVIIGLGSQSHPDFRRILEYVLDNYEIQISLPSLRTDVLQEEDIELVSRCGQKTLTIAPENSERIRKFLNKDFDDSKVEEICELAKKHGMDHVKLYFIAGLPGEDLNDLKSCVELVNKISNIFNGKLYVSINPWIRKPQTPLQYSSPLNIEEISRRLKFFISSISCRHTVYDPILAYAQMLLSLGDRDIIKALLYASELKMNNLSRSLWKTVMKRFGLMFKNYVFRSYDRDDTLPWSHIDVGISNNILWKRYEEYISAVCRGNKFSIS